MKRPRGVRARDGAFGGGRHLVFLHGRAQQGKDPEALRREWAAGLNMGLVRAGLPVVAPADVCFPFYGDRLAHALDARESVTPAAGTPEATLPGSPGARAVYEEILGEAAARWYAPPGAGEGVETAEGLGLDPLVAAVWRGLGWLAARSDIDTWTISRIFRDVAAYLDDRDIREEVLGCVLETVPREGEWVFVTHSLGTVVGMDLLTRLPAGVRVVRLTTLGSPLGMDSVRRRLLSGGQRRPARSRTGSTPGARPTRSPSAARWATTGRTVRRTSPSSTPATGRTTSSNTSRTPRWPARSGDRLTV
ncbi:hypothetical protein LUX34_26670 [Streptomyces werraensis]|nr:hypothetical protein [Streptomyces werraensis]